jgi:hypothetical protein
MSALSPGARFLATHRSSTRLSPPLVLNLLTRAGVDERLRAVPGSDEEVVGGRIEAHTVGVLAQNHLPHDTGSRAIQNARAGSLTLRDHDAVPVGDVSDALRLAEALHAPDGVAPIRSIASAVPLPRARYGQTMVGRSTAIGSILPSTPGRPVVWTCLMVGPRRRRDRE